MMCFHGRSCGDDDNGHQLASVNSCTDAIHHYDNFYLPADDHVSRERFILKLVGKSRTVAMKPLCVLPSRVAVGFTMYAPPERTSHNCVHCDSSLTLQCCERGSYCRLSFEAAGQSFEKNSPQDHHSTPGVQPFDFHFMGARIFVFENKDKWLADAISMFSRVFSDSIRDIDRVVLILRTQPHPPEL